MQNLSGSGIEEAYPIIDRAIRHFVETQNFVRALNLAKGAFGFPSPQSVGVCNAAIGHYGVCGESLPFITELATVSSHNEQSMRLWLAAAAVSGGGSPSQGEFLEKAAKAFGGNGHIDVDIKQAEHLRDLGKTDEAIALLEKCTSEEYKGIKNEAGTLLATVTLAHLYLNSDKTVEALRLYSTLATTTNSSLDPSTLAVVEGNWALAILRGQENNKQEALQHFKSAVNLIDSLPKDVYGEMTSHMTEEAEKAKTWLDTQHGVVETANAKRIFSCLSTKFSNLQYLTSRELMDHEGSWFQWFLNLCVHHSVEIAEDCSMDFPSWSEDTKKQELIDPRHRYVVATDTQGVPVGCAAFRFYAEFGALLGSEAHVFVWDLHVDPSQRGKGLGSLLLKAVEAIAEEAGIPEVRLQFYYRSGNNKFYKGKNQYETH
eukprot:PhF_6_TR26294/c3_g1_i1/m.37696